MAPARWYIRCCSRTGSTTAPRCPATIITRPSKPPRRARRWSRHRTLPVSARYAALVADLLAQADIRIDGPRPWHIAERDPRISKRALAGGAIGLGASFMDVRCDSPALHPPITRLVDADL